MYPARRSKQCAPAGNDIVDKCQPKLTRTVLAREAASTDRRSAPRVLVESERSVMFEHSGALARSCEGGFSHRVPAPQDWPDICCKPNLLQTASQTLAHPIRTLRRRAARNRNQDNPGAECHGEPLVTYRLQPDPCGEMRQPNGVCSLHACA